jgi:hypothetical protein
MGAIVAEALLGARDSVWALLAQAPGGPVVASVVVTAVVVSLLLGLWLVARPRRDTTGPQQIDSGFRGDGAPGSQSSQSGHRVSCTAYAPQSAPSGQDFLIQIALHRAMDAAKARAQAISADPLAERRATTELEGEIRAGDRVELRLIAPDLSVDQPQQSVAWNGDPRVVQFVTRFNETAPLRVLVRLIALVNDAPVGQAIFYIGQSSGATSEKSSTALTPFKNVFVSYASANRVDVLKHAMLLKRLGLEVFQDLLALEPGERWEKALYKNIDKADLFLLYWSSQAAASDWVIKEAEYALARQDNGAEIQIMPVLLEGPPAPRPPQSLRAIHFNDPIRYIIAAQSAMASR